MFYKLKLKHGAKQDLDDISKYLEEYGGNKKKIIEKINSDIVEFSEKQNYLNSKTFILKEKSLKYVITK